VSVGPFFLLFSYGLVARELKGIYEVKFLAIQFSITKDFFRMD
jgi:hypothetical protein